MPFKKIGRGKNRGKYRSPSGDVYTARQVRLLRDHKRKPRKR